MTDRSARKPLRLWPGVTIVVLQLIALYVPRAIDPASSAMFFGMLGALTVGPLLFLIWWLFFSRARWIDRLGGLALLIGVHTITMLLVHTSAKMVAIMPGVIWLGAAFVASLFAGRRLVTVATVLVASLGWTLVQTDGVTGAFDSDYAWRWSKTAEQRFLASAASSVPGTTSGGLTIESSAWPGFRGPARDNVVVGLTVATDWDTHPPQELWRRPIAPGWSSFAMVGDRLCTMEQRGEDEAVVCYDAATGEPVWLHAYPARFWEVMGGLGPRATPTYHEGRLFTQGATGILNCLNAATGELIWSRNIAEDTGAEIPEWAFSASPLVVDDLVITHAAGAPDGKATVAYDIDSGELRWTGESGGDSYSSPHLATLDGVQQVVMLTGEGAFGLDPASGELLWKHDWSMGAGNARIVQPTILDDGTDLLIGTSFGFGTRRISLSQTTSGSWTVEEKWTSRGLKPYFSDLVVYDGVAYGVDGTILAAIDLETGERAWKGGRYGAGQLLLLADQGLLLVISEEGELVLVRATTEKFEEVAKIEALDGKTWNHPIVVDGIVYLRNSEEMAAYRLPE